LFLVVRFVVSRIIVISWLGCSSRTSYLSRRGVVLEVYVMGLSGRDVMWAKRFTHRATKTSAVNQESGQIGAKLRAILGTPLADANLEA
jgi:hypothetical protein